MNHTKKNKKLEWSAVRHLTDLYKEEEEEERSSH